MREVILDTETTGLDPKTGHRLVEIGAVELINHTPTGVTYQTYINPERDVDAGAQEIHGLTNEFLKQHPTFISCVTKNIFPRVVPISTKSACIEGLRF